MTDKKSKPIVEAKLTIPIKISHAQKRFLIYPDEETTGPIKEWLYLFAARKEFYYDKYVGAYFVKSSLLRQFKETFNVEVKSDGWRPQRRED
jgi:hypothetical protein